MSHLNYPIGTQQNNSHNHDITTEHLVTQADCDTFCHSNPLSNREAIAESQECVGQQR